MPSPCLHNTPAHVIDELVLRGRSGDPVPPDLSWQFARLVRVAFEELRYRAAYGMSLDEYACSLMGISGDDDRKHPRKAARPRWLRSVNLN